jgi:hypothetical protein
LCCHTADTDQPSVVDWLTLHGLIMACIAQRNGRAVVVYVA